MALNNTYTYNLSVTYGRYYTNKTDDGIPSPEASLKWCWKATATIIYPSTSVPIIPSGWENGTPICGSIKTITAIAFKWDVMSTYIAELTTFWGESQEENTEENPQEPSQEEDPNENV